MSRHPLSLQKREIKQVTDMKPKGLWYSFQNEWKEWVKNEMPHWLGEYEYLVNLNDSKVLELKSPKDINQFNKKYGKEKIVSVIDWHKVSQEYDAIEINPYQWSLRHELLWYFGWDVSSGCVWNFEKVTVEEVT